MKTIKRKIPARTEYYHVKWCRPFMVFGDFKKARDRARMKTAKTCFLCHGTFADESQTHLCCIEKKGNKIICDECAEETT